MAVGNDVTIVGNITREPELRYTASGQAVASFGIANNRRWQNKKTDEWEEAVSFFDVTVWREMAENVAESLQKGARVVITGRLEQQTWDDKETGDPRSKVVIVADEVAPSLRWATAEIAKNERSDESSGGGGRSSGNRSSGGGSRSGSKGRSSGRRKEPEFDPDEEPFRMDAGEWLPEAPGEWGQYPTRLL